MYGVQVEKKPQLSVLRYISGREVEVDDTGASLADVLGRVVSDLFESPYITQFMAYPYSHLFHT